jgi:hypothetical protein
MRRVGASGQGRTGVRLRLVAVRQARIGRAAMETDFGCLVVRRRVDLWRWLGVVQTRRVWRG